METLESRVVECVKATTKNMTDYDQRSALGIARSWIDKRKPIERADPFYKMGRRDDLAEALVEILKDCEAEEGVAALGVARDMVNAPFLDERMLGFRAMREKRGEIGAPKKKERG